MARLSRGSRWLKVEALALVAAGLFALYLSSIGRFLPHDVAFLGMTAEQICADRGCRIVHFMIHDRASFGGALVALGSLYYWLAAVPLRKRHAWAWWILLLSGLVGFSSFLAYLGYGYLDTWHGIATLTLLPCHVLGLRYAHSELAEPRGISTLSAISLDGRGRMLLMITAVGFFGAGLTICTIGMTAVFVPEDLAFMGVQPADLTALNPRLIPLIAHDRAGFGGVLCSLGVAMWGCVSYGPLSRGLWWILLSAGCAGFGSTFLVHWAIGYDDLFHLAPAVVGAAIFTLGMGLSRPFRRGDEHVA